ncbi:hypothetical protein SAMN02910323_1203 [Selenomonas ruminantium]|uniref:Uncharacterized protein n=1 Tax=Selenomonas ruminantium TaxID=971 RepID=A0A1K1N5X7_SELRU|nr:hypothetical protein SAMN02910323_1203 [Selenomonas ruminantium]
MRCYDDGTDNVYCLRWDSGLLTKRMLSTPYPVGPSEKGGLLHLTNKIYNDL